MPCVLAECTSKAVMKTIVALAKQLLSCSRAPQLQRALVHELVRVNIGHIYCAVASFTTSRQLRLALLRSFKAR